MSVFGSIIKGIFTGGGAEGKSNVIASIGNALDGIITSKEEKDKAVLAITQEINRHAEVAAAEGTKLMAMELEREKEEMKNTADARAMNTKIQDSDKASWLSKNIGFIIDGLLTITWCVMTVFLIARALKLAGEDADLTAVLSVYATVTAMLANILNYHRGSTAGSSRKDKALQEMAKK